MYIQRLERLIYRFYLGPLLTAAGLSDKNTQLVLNIALSAWFFLTGLVGTIIIDKVRRRTLFSKLTDFAKLTVDLSDIAMIPLLILIGILTKRRVPESMADE